MLYLCLLGITFYYIINGPGNSSSQAEKRQSDEVLNMADPGGAILVIVGLELWMG